jgi:hypothetical protein
VRRMVEIRHLEHDAHVARDGQPLTVGQREQLVHVQHAVQVLHPFRVHVAVEDNPLALIQLSTDIVNNLAQDVREQAVRPLPGIRVGKNPVFFKSQPSGFYGFFCFFFGFFDFFCFFIYLFLRVFQFQEYF